MTFDVERYLNVRRAWGGSLSPDGETTAFLMDTTGVPQVWTVAEPGAWPAQRTFFEERVTFLDWSPTREECLFGMDEGGNERADIYRLDIGDGTIANLTQAPEAKHRYGGMTTDGEQFAFASNRRDERVFDVYVQSRSEQGDAAIRVHEGDGWLSVAGFSPADDRLLVHEARSNFDHDLYVLNLVSKSIRQVTPFDGENRFRSPEWGPDGEAIYCCTDVGADTTALARLDLDTLSLSTVREGGDWNIDGVKIEVDTGRLVHTRNVDGYTDLTVGELTDPLAIEEYPTPELPGEIAGGVDFGPAGEQFVITASGRRVNPNVFRVEIETGATTRLTMADTAGIPQSTFRTPDVIHYESHDGLQVPAFLTLPETTVPDETPVIIDVHGGPESQRRPTFSATKQYFLNRGYALFEPNIRGSTGYGREYTTLDDRELRMDAVADVAAGVAWLADHRAIDPDRIAIKGGSYGGFVVLAAMTEYPGLFAAGIDVVGIANFVTFLENTGEWRRALREAEYGSLVEDRDLLEELSPFHDIDQIEAPLFVVHGENDPRVPVGEARQVAEAAREQGVAVEMCIFEDEGHGLTKRENRIEAYTAIADFLDDHIGTEGGSERDTGNGQ